MKYIIFKNKKIVYLCIIVSLFFLNVVGQLILPNEIEVTEPTSSVCVEEPIVIYPLESFIEENLVIKISSYEKKYPIYYTLDGSIPTRESNCYTEPLQFNVDEELQVVVVRASVLKDGELSKPVTQTYFIGEDVESRFTTQVVSIATDEENLYDYEKGIFVRGKMYDAWLEAGGNPDAPIYLADANYMQRTDEWVRDGHVEVFSSDGLELVDIDAGISVAGTATSSYPIKSINIKTDERYSLVSRYFNFVENGRELEGIPFSNVGAETNSVRLRNSGNDLYSILIRQNVCNEIALQSGLKTTSIVTPVVTFINGQYYSLLQAQNNFSSSNLGKMLSLETDYITKIGEKEWDVFATLNPEINFYTADFNDPYIREEFEKIVDIDEFFLYYALQILIDNIDWPNNNYKVMRYTGEPMDGNPYSDGKIHFLFFGTECGFELYDSVPMFEALFDNDLPEEKRSGARLITNVLNYEPYKGMFVNQICDLLSTTFKAENVAYLFYKYLDYIDEEVPYLVNVEDERVQELPEEIADRVEDVTEKTYERIEKYPEYLKEHFAASNPYQIIISSPGTTGEIHCNSIVVDETVEGMFEGTYYANYPIQIKAVENPGYRFTHFLINGIEYTEDELVISDDIIIDDKVIVEAYFEETEGLHPTITAVSAEGSNDWVEITNYYMNDINLGEFYLSDDKGELWKCPCPNVVLKHGDTIRIVGKNNLTFAEYRLSFALKEMETIYLSDEKGEVNDFYFIPRE